MPCMLDYFPCEVLHTIFDHMKPSDLLHAFVPLTPYIDTVFNSYVRLQLNFKSVKKSIFYSICENVRSHQIQSVILSDDEYTPGQTKLFMSLLPLIQFDNLQYFSLNEMVDSDLLCLIFSHLENHVQLCWLSLTGSHIQISKKKTRYIVGILQTLPSLKYLTFIDSSSLLYLRAPLSKLTHLTLNSCIPNDLGVIFQWLPNLLHLRIMIPMNHRIPVLENVPPHLISLQIESRSWTLFDDIENLLSLMISLKRLTLEAMGEQTLIDANRWKIFIKTKLPHLKELALNITPEENTMNGDGVLTPFQDPFWTIEKRWSMACFISTTSESCARLYSVPHFAPLEAWYPPSEGFYHYSLTPYPFDDHCTNLRLSLIPSDILISSPFQHVHTLSLESLTNNFEQLQAIVNFSSVKHLKVEHSVQCPLFKNILQAAPNIQQLTVNRATLINIIHSRSDDELHVYKQIKQLRVDDTLSDQNIDGICELFPKLEHISISIKEPEHIAQILNKFPSLTSATISSGEFFPKFLSVVERCLQENEVCQDGTYELCRFALNLWMD